MSLRAAPTLAIATIFMLLFDPPHVFAQWAPVADGVELLQQPLHGGQITMTFLRVSLDKFDVRVAVPRISKFGASSSDATSNPDRSPRGLFLDDYINRYNALAAISASYVETFSPPTPLGQIKSDGLITGTSHSSWATEGTFCSDKGRALVGISSDLAAKSNYRDCLEVGPLLLLGGAIPNALPSSSATGTDYNRMINGQVPHSIVCIDNAGRVLLGLTAKSGATLSEIVTTIQQAPIKCSDAIRLQPGGMRVNSDLFGVDRYLHPSALLVIK